MDSFILNSESADTGTGSSGNRGSLCDRFQASSHSVNHEHESLGPDGQHFHDEDAGKSSIPSIPTGLTDLGEHEPDAAAAATQCTGTGHRRFSAAVRTLPVWPLPCRRATATLWGRSCLALRHRQRPASTDEPPASHRPGVHAQPNDATGSPSLRKSAQPASAHYPASTAASVGRRFHHQAPGPRCQHPLLPPPAQGPALEQVPHMPQFQPGFHPFQSANDSALQLYSAQPPVPPPASQQQAQIPAHAMTSGPPSFPLQAHDMFPRTASRGHTAMSRPHPLALRDTFPRCRPRRVNSGLRTHRQWQGQVGGLHGILALAPGRSAGTSWPTTIPTTAPRSRPANDPV